MWPEFFIACSLGAAFLLCPGYLFLRIFRMARGHAACAAPLFSTLLFSILSIVYESIGIFADPVSVILIPTALLALVSGALLLVAKDTARGDRADGSPGIILLYAVAGLVAGALIFVSRLEGPLSFLESWDEVHHLNGTQAFAESGVFSFFHSSSYTAQEAATIAPLEAGGFYPSGWQVVCALVVQAAGVPASLAINAVNYIYSSLAFPLGMALFLDTLFDHDGRLLAIGSLVSVSFAAFPWLLICWGPIFPNLAAYCMVPAACALFLRAYGGQSALELAKGLALFLLGLLGIVFLQPNGIFVVAVMIGSFLVREALQGRLQERIGFVSKNHPRDALVLTLLFAALWFAVNRMPPLRGIVDFNWEKYQSPVRALINFATLGYVDGFFAGSAAQPVLAALLVYGIVRALQKKSCTWLFQSYLFWGIALVLSTSTEGLLKHLFAGFWYTDHCRLASAAAISAIPLATIGVGDLLQRLAGVFEGRLPKGRGKLAETAMLALYAAAIFFPTFHIPGISEVQTGFGRLCSTIESDYRAEGGMIDTDELAFLEEVAEIVPDGAIVANNPLDGSVFAYGAYDIHILYRSVSGYESSERGSSRIIRSSLGELPSDDAVGEAVDDLRIEYVLLLNVDSPSAGYINSVMGDGTAEWAGLYGIDDETPGFTLVLEEGAMRLYKLDEAA